MAEERKLTRAFIAIDFPDNVIKEVVRVQELVGKKMFTGKFTEPENLHLTLKFLGEIDSVKLEEVKKKLAGIEFKEFDAKLGEIGCFGPRGEPRIVWIKICGEDIWELQRKIDDVLKGLFKPEERFMSHLTIARIRYVKDGKSFMEYVKNLGVKEIKFKIKSFELKSSELKPLGPAYTTLEKYECKKEKQVM